VPVSACCEPRHGYPGWVTRAPCPVKAR
jgi:hypothetical protein